MSAGAEHGQVHVTIIDMLTLQFTTPAACPSADRHALKKKKNCQHAPIAGRLSPPQWHWFADS